MADTATTRPVKKQRTDTAANPLLQYNNKLQCYVCKICSTQLSSTNEWTIHTKQSVHIDGINALKNRVQQLKSGQSNTVTEHTTEFSSDGDDSTSESDTDDNNAGTHNELPADFFDAGNAATDTVLHTDIHNDTTHTQINNDTDEVIDIVDTDDIAPISTKHYNIKDNDITIDTNNTQLSKQLQQTIDRQAVDAYEAELKQIEYQEQLEYQRMNATLEVALEQDEKQQEQSLTQRVQALKERAAQAKKHVIK